MARKLKGQEPLLTAVARKLGQAAGTLVNMTQMLTAEQTTLEKSAASKRESSKPESPQKKKKISATIRQNRPTKQGHANPKKRTKARKASTPHTITSKRGSRRKR